MGKGAGSSTVAHSTVSMHVSCMHTMLTKEARVKVTDGFLARNVSMKHVCAGEVERWVAQTGRKQATAGRFMVPWIPILHNKLQRADGLGPPIEITIDGL